jgi:4-amino-4-deoxy-L-arabinose transferase-like glycosyltransferase
VTTIASADSTTFASSPTGRRLGKIDAMLLAVFAFVIEVTYCLTALRHYSPVSDASHYLSIADSIAHGRGWSSVFPYLWEHPTAFRPPLYPLVLGSIFTFTGTTVGAAQALNVMFGCVVVVLAATVAARLADRPAGLVAGGLVAVYPPMLANDGVPLTEPLALALMLGIVLALMSRRLLLAGVLCGLLMLTRPSAQLLVPITAVWLLAIRVPWRRVLAYAAVTAAVVTPWLIRNEVVFGTPVLVTSDGFNLAAIYSPVAIRDGHFIDPARDARLAGVRAYARSSRNLDEADLDAAFQAEGVRGIREHPGAVPRIIAGNVGYLFDLRWRADDDAERLDGRDMVLRHATLPLVWLVTAAGLGGLWLGRRRAGCGVVWLCVVYFTAVGIATVAPPRLRAPVDVCCCIGFALLITYLRSWWSGHGPESTVPSMRRYGRIEPAPAQPAPRPVVSEVPTQDGYGGSLGDP